MMAEDVRWMVVLLVAALAAAAPRIRSGIFHAIRRLRRIPPPSRNRLGYAVFAAAVAYLTLTALRQQRDLFPKYHDSQSYALQAQILATGRLWLPPPALPDFFDTFHVIVEPVYCSMYFPGAAIMYTPGIWLGLPFCVIPLVIAGASVALLCRVMAEIIDPFAGLLAALWMLSLFNFRHLSPMLFSHPVMLLLGMALLWAWLRWRRSGELRWVWATLIGVLGSWAAVTRPVDAIAYAVPIGIAMVMEMWRSGWKRLNGTCALIIVGAAPLLGLQLVFNRGVSGDWFTSPYRVYLDRDAPQFSFGFHEYDAARKPRSVILQKRIYHLAYNVPLIIRHRLDNLPETWLKVPNLLKRHWPEAGRLFLILKGTTPTLLLVPLIVLGLFGLRTTPARVLAAVFPLYCGLYLFYAALLPHYTPVVAPAVIVLGLLGAKQVEAFWVRHRPVVATFMGVAVVGFCVSRLPELNPHDLDDPFPYPEMNDMVERVPRLVREPALVFVRYPQGPSGSAGRGSNVHSEPVFNWQAARIDDNPIIKAHDLAERNVDLIEYYAQRQPDRSVYYYDRATRHTTPGAGTVVQELERLRRAENLSPATQPATTNTAAGAAGDARDP